MRLRNTSLWRTAISDNYFFRAAVAFAIMQASRRELLTPHGSRIVLAAVSYTHLVRAQAVQSQNNDGSDGVLGALGWSDEEDWS